MTKEAPSSKTYGSNSKTNQFVVFSCGTIYFWYHFYLFMTHYEKRYFL